MTEVVGAPDDEFPHVQGALLAVAILLLAQSLALGLFGWRPGTFGLALGSVVAMLAHVGVIHLAQIMRARSGDDDAPDWATKFLRFGSALFLVFFVAIGVMAVPLLGDVLAQYQGQPFLWTGNVLLFAVLTAGYLATIGMAARTAYTGRL